MAIFEPEFFYASLKRVDSVFPGHTCWMCCRVFPQVATSLTSWRAAIVLNRVESCCTVCDEPDIVESDEPWYYNARNRQKAFGELKRRALFFGKEEVFKECFSDPVIVKQYKRLRKEALRSLESSTVPTADEMPRPQARNLVTEQVVSPPHGFTEDPPDICVVTDHHHDWSTWYGARLPRRRFEFLLRVAAYPEAAHFTGHRRNLSHIGTQTFLNLCDVGRPCRPE